MKIFVTAVLFFLIYTNSFSQSLTRQDTLIFYSTITKQLNEITPKVQELWGKVQNAVMNASGKPPYKADPAILEDIKSSSSYNVNDLDKAIRNVTVLTDIEPGSGLKEMVTGLFGELRSTQQLGIPVLISVLTVGTDKITPQQTSSMKSFISKGSELRSRLAQINNLLSQYASRNIITADEMNRMGL